MAYFVYENWQAGPHKAVLHFGGCGYCKDGGGRGSGTDPKHGKWHGPFIAIDEARAIQRSLRVECRRDCGCVARSLNSEAPSGSSFLGQRKRLLARLEDAHERFYATSIFGGPSLHFHLRTLAAGARQDLDQFAESAYALLCSWGMHRMGPGGSKMKDFAEFRASLEGVWSTALALQQVLPAQMTAADWMGLKSVFTGLRCMASGTSLVGNSKVMAHLLPKLVPPVDRQYTWAFLCPTAQIKNDLELEWTNLAMLLRDFFYPVIGDPLLVAKAQEWMSQSARFKWDTSPLKIVDNLVVGIVQIDTKRAYRAAK